jgi:hypothetical protein
MELCGFPMDGEEISVYGCPRVCNIGTYSRELYCL